MDDSTQFKFEVILSTFLLLFPLYLSKLVTSSVLQNGKRMYPPFELVCQDGNGRHHSSRVSDLFAFPCAHKAVTSRSILTTILPLHSISGKEVFSRPSVDILKTSRIQCRRSLLHSSLSTSGLTISASTHLRNLYISKKFPSRCRYQVYTLDSSNLSLLTSTPIILGLDTSS
ncbi:hypothetical protein Tco_0601757 [Tanacetum coccineum]